MEAHTLSATGGNGGTSFTSRIRVYQSSAQSIPSGDVTKVQFDTKVYDNDNEYDNSTNYRFTAKAEGYYHINTTCSMYDPGADKYGCVIIKKNGIEVARTLENYGSINGVYQNVSTDVYLNGSTDYIEVYVQHNKGSNLDTLTGDDRTNLCIHRFA